MNECGDARRRGHRELWSYPASGESVQLTLAQLCDAARAAEEDFTGSPFLFFYEDGREVPYCIEDGIEAVVEFTDFAAQLRADFWQLRQSGFFFQRTPMWEDSFAPTRESRPVMEVTAFAIYAALGLRCVTRLYEELFEGSMPVTIGVRVTDADGRSLQSPDGPAMPVAEACVCRAPEIECVQTHALDEWKGNLRDCAVYMCDHVFRGFNWTEPDLRACRRIIDDLLARRLEA